MEEIDILLAPGVDWSEVARSISEVDARRPVVPSSNDHGS
jgi:hypothetical protein